MDGAAHAQADLIDLEWADGIALGTPIGDGVPAPALMRFLSARSRSGAAGGCTTRWCVFTDELEHIAPDSVLRPIYNALYRWGAVIVGPRSYELEPETRRDRPAMETISSLPTARLRTTQYRATRLARLARVLADERSRRARLAL